jgi:nitric oxide synthase-interacting protein
VRAVQDFERVQMGLEAKIGKAGTKIVGREDGKIMVEEDAIEGKKGEKRKFELNEDELLRIAQEERNKARKTIDDEKVILDSLFCMFLITI